MTDETMRMAAEIVDKFSGPLKEMQKQLRGLAEVSKKSHDEGKKRTAEHAKAYSDLKRNVHELTDRVSSGLRPAMEAVGVTTLSVAAAIAGISASIKEFSGVSRELSYLNRETNLSVNTLRAWGAVANRVGSSTQAMQQGLSSFSEHMQKLRRNAPDEVNAWLQMGPAVHAFGMSIRNLNREDQLNAVVNFLDRIRDQDQKRRLLSFLGLPKELANENSKVIRQHIDEVKKSFATLKPGDIEAGKRSQLEFDRMAESVSRLKMEIGAGLAPELTKITESLREFMTANQGAIVDTLKDIATYIKSVDWQSFATGVKDTAQSVDSVAQAFGGWKTVLEALVALKVATWAFGIAKSVTAIATALGAVGSAGSALPAWIIALIAGGAVAQGQMEARGVGSTDGDKDKRIGGVDAFGNLLFEGKADKKIEEGTKKGILEGLREYFSLSSAEAAPGGGSPGGTLMSRLRQSQGRSYAGKGGDLPDDGPVGDAPVSDLALAMDRAGFGKEVADNPKLKEKIFGIIMGENKDPIAGLAVLESMMNRAKARGTSLAAQARLHAQSGINEGGYYAGYRPGDVARYRKQLERIWQRALGGSNVNNYSTDNASNAPGNDLANRHIRSGKFRFQKKYNGEYFFQPGWYGRPEYERWRRGLEERRRRMESDPRSGVVSDGQKLGMNGGRVEGSARLAIDLNGFPRGTRTSWDYDGMFKQVSLNRGSTMPLASEVA